MGKITWAWQASGDLEAITFIAIDSFCHEHVGWRLAESRAAL